MIILRKFFFSNAQRAFEQYIENMQEELERLKKSENIIENDNENKPGPSMDKEKGGTVINPLEKKEKRKSSIFEISFISSEQEKRYKNQYHRAEEIKRIHGIVFGSVRGCSETSYRSNLKHLNEYWQRFDHEHEEINSVKTVGDDDESYHFSDVFEDTREFYNEAL